MNPQDKSDASSGGHADFRPGETISPQSPDSPAAPTPSTTLPEQPQSAAIAPALVPTPVAAAVPVDPALADNASATPAPAVSTPAAPPQEAERELFHPDADDVSADESFVGIPHDDRSFSWTASEFIAHHKDPTWYMGLVGATAVIALLVFLITRDYLSAGMVILGAIIFGISASRQPRELQYAVDSGGLTVGRKTYPYRDFRSFTIAEEGSFSSITFMPLKRFAPAISIYYDPAAEKSIMDVLSNHLPMQDHKHDPVDRLMRRIRF